MKTSINQCRASVLLTAITAKFFTSAAYAGRPLTVDDAGTGEKGHGHVEMWAAREAGKTDTLNLSPAFVLYDGFEIAGAIARERKSNLTALALQAKWVVTESQENGCNVGIVAGAAKVRNTDERATYVNGLVTCNAKDVGSVHFNLGGEKPRGSTSIRTWGVAVEKEVGPVTPHLEWFGAKGEKPTVQVGMRTELVKSLQLDGTVGRTDGESVYSVGMKVQF